MRIPYLYRTLVRNAAAMGPPIELKLFPTRWEVNSYFNNYRPQIGYSIHLQTMDRKTGEFRTLECKTAV